MKVFKKIISLLLVFTMTATMFSQTVFAAAEQGSMENNDIVSLNSLIENGDEDNGEVTTEPTTTPTQSPQPSAMPTQTPDDETADDETANEDTALPSAAPSAAPSATPVAPTTVQTPVTKQAKADTLLSAPLTQEPGTAEGTVKINYTMVDGPNLLVNGSFENGMAGYNPWGGAIASANIIVDDAAQGSKAVKVTSTGFTGGYFSAVKNAQYTFSAYGKTEGNDNVAWVTMNADQVSSGSKDISLEFNEKTYTKKSLTIRDPRISTFRATAWKDPNPTVLYCDDMSLTIKSVTDAGNLYYYSAGDTAAAQPTMGETKPAEYDTILVSGDTVTRNKNAYINIVEVDTANKVVGFEAVKVLPDDSNAFAVNVVGGTADKQNAAKGETVTITATDAGNFAGWTSTDGVAFDNAQSATTTFVMPEKAVTVTALSSEYDYEKDFKANTQGPVWYAEYIEGGKVNLFTEWHQEWMCYVRGALTAGLDNGNDNMALIAARTGAESAFTWVAPKDGTVELSIARFAQVRRSLNESNKVGFHIQKNYKTISEDMYAHDGRSNGTSMVMRPLIVDVKKGDRISFNAFGTNSQPSDGSAFFAPKVKYTDKKAVSETNIAPQATVTVSSTASGNTIAGLTDGNISTGKKLREWKSNGTTGEWLNFAFNANQDVSKLMFVKSANADINSDINISFSDGTSQTIAKADLKNAAGYVIIDLGKVVTTDFVKMEFVNATSPIAIGDVQIIGDTSKVQLRTLYNLHKDKKEADYLPAQWEAFKTALAEAEAKLASATTPEENMAAYKALEAAAAALKQVFTVTVVNGTPKTLKATEGETITITADKTEDAFKNWASDDGVVFANETSETTTFVMPKNNVTVRAVYGKIYPAGTSFYVDSVKGDDAAAGTSPSTAWKSLAKINELTLKAGDKVLLKAGSVFDNQGLAPNGNGTIDAPIIIDMYDGNTIGSTAGAKPIINANGKPRTDVVRTGVTSNVAYGLLVKNVSNITVNNLEITNTTGSRRLSVGALVEAKGIGVASNIHLNAIDVHDVFGTLLDKDIPNGGIYFVTTDPLAGGIDATRFDNISVQNCSVADVSRSAISVGNSHSWRHWDGQNGRIPEATKEKYGHTNVLIKNNYVKNIGGDAIVPQFCISPVTEYNISDTACKDSPYNGGAYNAGVWPWRCEDAIFQYNEVFNTVVNGDGTAFDCDWNRGTVYQYNYSHDNGGGFMLICQVEALESVIRYNVSQNDRRDVFLTSNPNNADIYNNTIYIGKGLSTGIDSYSGKAKLTNNIFYNEGSNKRPNWGAQFTYDNNLFYGFDTTPNDPHKIIADPMFIDGGKGGSGVKGDSAIDTLTGYRLAAGSPAIDKGVVIANNGGKDYEGNPIVGTPDIGAFESSAYKVTVNGGTADITDAQLGDTVKITAAPPATGKVFDKWTAQGVTLTDEYSATTTFKMPAGNVTLIAVYKDILYNVTVNGGTTDKATASLGETVTITATPATGKAFEKWTAQDGVTLTNATAAETTFTMPAGNVTLIAVYKDILYNVTVNGGTTDKATAKLGETVTITATPATGKVFDKWTATGVTLKDANATETTFTMPAGDVTVTASYKDVFYDVTVANGTADKKTAKLGETVKITATAPATGKVFDKWTAQGVTLKDANAASTTFTMPAGDVTVTASYKDVFYDVTVANGTADKKAAKLGDTVTITATAPATGKVFDKWTAQGVTIKNENDAKTTFTMPAGDVTVKAEYKNAPVAPQPPQEPNVPQDTTSNNVEKVNPTLRPTVRPVVRPTVKPDVDNTENIVDDEVPQNETPKFTPEVKPNDNGTALAEPNVENEQSSGFTTSGMIAMVIAIIAILGTAIGALILIVKSKKKNK